MKNALMSQKKTGFCSGIVQRMLTYLAIPTMALVLAACGGSSGGTATEEIPASTDPDLTVTLNSVSRILATTLIANVLITNISANVSVPSQDVYISLFFDEASPPAVNSPPDSILVALDTGLAPGSSQSLSYQTSNSTPFGTAYAAIDSLLGLTEANESNNVSAGLAWPTYSYTVTSSNFAVGNIVSVIRADVAGPGCVGFTNFSRVGSGTVTTAGTVSFTFSDNRSSTFFESTYIDKNASGTLNTGDLVWGPSSTGISGLCLNPAAYNSVQPFDWDTIAAGIGGSVTYTGTSQTFLVEQGTDIGISAVGVEMEGNGY